MFFGNIAIASCLAISALLFAVTNAQDCCPKLIVPDGIDAAGNCKSNCFEGFDMQNINCKNFSKKAELSSSLLNVHTINGSIIVKEVRNCEIVLLFEQVKVIRGDVVLKNMDNTRSIFENIQKISPTTWVCNLTIDVTGLRDEPLMVTNRIKAAATTGINDCLAQRTTTTLPTTVTTSSVAQVKSATEESNFFAENWPALGGGVGFVGLAGVIGVVLFVVFAKKKKNKQTDIELGSTSQQKSTPPSSPQIPPQQNEGVKKPGKEAAPEATKQKKTDTSLVRTPVPTMPPADPTPAAPEEAKQKKADTSLVRTPVPTMPSAEPAPTPAAATSTASGTG